eukprot:TRINITY_DN29874_c0_g1_i1.p1 TRINITY_DN29874_c0_g1~~TRINITY_DN29874_c0_g1_i1.p1  ORF type:complete len:542 (+),score=65.84 TRINITY_DN29874_c0_g1_i1:91-1716(+)
MELPKESEASIRAAGCASKADIWRGFKQFSSYDVENVCRKACGEFSPKLNHRQVTPAPTGPVPLEGTSGLSRLGVQQVPSSQAPWAVSADMPRRPSVTRRYSVSSLERGCRPSSADAERRFRRTHSDADLETQASRHFLASNILTAEDNFLGRRAKGLCAPSRMRSASLDVLYGRFDEGATLSAREGSQQARANKSLFGMGSLDVDRPCGRRRLGSCSPTSRRSEVLSAPQNPRVSPRPSSRFSRASSGGWSGTSAEIQLQKSIANLNVHEDTPRESSLGNLSARGPPSWVFGLRETRVDIRRLMRACDAHTRVCASKQAAALGSHRAQEMQSPFVQELSDLKVAPSSLEMPAHQEPIPDLGSESLKELGPTAWCPQGNIMNFARERLHSKSGSSAMSTSASSSGALDDKMSASSSFGGEHGDLDSHSMPKSSPTSRYRPLQRVPSPEPASPWQGLGASKSSSGFGTSGQSACGSSISSRSRCSSAARLGRFSSGPRSPILATEGRSMRRQEMRAAKHASPPRATFGAQTRQGTSPRSLRA